LSYRVLVHLRSIHDYSPHHSSPSGDLPSDNGDSGHDGDLERHHFHQGSGAEIQRYPRAHGVLDGEAAGSAGNCCDSTVPHDKLVGAFNPMLLEAISGHSSAVEYSPADNHQTATPGADQTTEANGDMVEATPVRDNSASTQSAEPPIVPDAQQCTPSTQSAERRLKVFTRRVTRSSQPPLLQLPEQAPEADARPWIPSRSIRLAAQNISHIPVAKRGEVLLMRRMGFSQGLQEPSPATKQMYEEIFSGASEHSEALRQLFPPEDDVGPRKRRRRPSARA